MDLKLTNKVALVTGAARGIGQAIAAALAQEGARLAVVDQTEDMAETLGLVAAAGSRAVPLSADVGDPGAVEAMVERAAAALGEIDILVNNAGIVSRRSLLDVPAEEFDRVLRTNLYGCFNATRAVARRMVAAGRPGRVINISSIHGRVAKAGMGSYCASKAGIDMLTRQFAVELGRSGITVNAVAPGTIETDINLPLYRSKDPADEPLKRGVLRRIPLDRIGSPRDIAALVTFLASESAGYITGSIHYVDGGYTAEGTPVP